MAPLELASSVPALMTVGDVDAPFRPPTAESHPPLTPFPRSPGFPVGRWANRSRKAVLPSLTGICWELTGERPGAEGCPDRGHRRPAFPRFLRASVRFLTGRWVPDVGFGGFTDAVSSSGSFLVFFPFFFFEISVGSYRCEEVGSVKYRRGLLA